MSRAGETEVPAGALQSMETQRNLAARAAGWSAAHWKTAAGGWLAFVVAAVALGSLAGTHPLAQLQHLFRHKSLNLVRPSDSFFDRKVRVLGRQGAQESAHCGGVALELGLPPRD